MIENDDTELHKHNECIFLQYAYDITAQLLLQGGSLESSATQYLCRFSKA